MTEAIAKTEQALPEVVVESLTVNEAMKSSAHAAKVYGIVREMISSGALPKSIKNPMQVMTIVEHGKDYGMSAIQALNSIEMVMGTPRIKAKALCHLIKKQYGEDAFRVVHWDETRCEISVNILDHEGNRVPSVSYSIEEAKAAGLVAKNDVWRKFPKNMIFAKCARDMWSAHFQGLGNGVIELAELVERKPDTPAPQTLGDI